MHLSFNTQRVEIARDRGEFEQGNSCFPISSNASIEHHFALDFKDPNAAIKLHSSNV
ncbi:MAG: hypothetical protein L0207_00100 [Chlamydiae bacterium]|nr:hypothetical protein [Chlamydiota bacterium]